MRSYKTAISLLFLLIYTIFPELMAVAEQTNKNYHGVSIIQRDAAVLNELEKMLGEKIPHVENIENTTFGYKAAAGKVVALRLEEQGLTVLPELIGDLKDLEYFGVRYNRLESIPTSITRLQNLKKMYVGRNPLKSIPESIGDLSNLEILYLNFTKLTRLPESISNLENLKQLWVEFSTLKSLPESIGNLENLCQILRFR